MFRNIHATTGVVKVFVLRDGKIPNTQVSWLHNKPSDNGMDNNWVHNSFHLQNILCTVNLFEIPHNKTFKPTFPLIASATDAL